jgi:hypothetical protein
MSQAGCSRSTLRNHGDLARPPIGNSIPILKAGCRPLENTTGDLTSWAPQLSFSHRAAPMTTLKIVNLHHDFSKRRSLVTVAWQDDADTHLGLVVPFECPLENLKAEAEKVVRALARELETATIENS